ncbi:MAG: hypothetical protein SGILL_004958 [Bacillariaceae sp.]
MAHDGQVMKKGRINRWIFALLAAATPTSKCFVPSRQLRHCRLSRPDGVGTDRKLCVLMSSDQDTTMQDKLSSDTSIDDEDDFDDTDDDEEIAGDDDTDVYANEDENIMFRPHNFARKEDWLEDATSEVFNPEKVPLGTLTDGDVESIVGLMVAWSRKNSMEAALTVERLLKRVVDDMHAGNTAVEVTTRMYAIVIDAWARSGHRSAAQRAQEIHDAMIQAYRETDDENMKPMLRSFNAVLKAWGRSKDPCAVEKSEELFQEILAECEKDDSIRPDAATICHMLEMYARDGSKSAIASAEDLFSSMDDLGVTRTSSVYSSMQNVYMSAGRNAPEKTMKVLQDMIELSSADGSAVRPNCINFNTVLCAYSRDRRQEAGTRAIELLEKMELPLNQGGYDVCPDKMSYAVTILACSRNSDPTHGARLAENLLERMEECARAEAKQREEVSSVARPLIEMDVECFNTVITCLSKSQDVDAVERIFRIIGRMKNDYSDDIVRPNVRSWNGVLNALSRERTNQSAQQTELILEDMFKAYNNGTLAGKPDEFSYAAVLGAYQKLHTREAAERADAILMHMDKLYEDGNLDHPPDVFHCTIVCSCWAKSRSKDAPQKCTEILSRMTARYKEGFPKCKPTARAFAAVLDCFSRAKLPERAETLLYHMLSLARQGDKDAQPDAVAFDIVIYAFLNSNLRDAGQRAELVLERGLEQAAEEGGEMLKFRSFSALLGYYGSQNKVADSPYRAESILNRLVSLFQDGHSKLSPSVSSFTNVMDAYATQGNRDAGACAENLLKTMIKLKRDYNAEQIEVNTGVMNRVLHAWQASVGSEESGRRAERLLDLMEEKQDQGNYDMSPNFSSYSKVIGAWSKSPLPDKADRALAVLRRLERRIKIGKMRGKIPEYAYGLVINACAFTQSKDPEQNMRLFHVAQDLLNELIEKADNGDERSEPSPTTYGWYFQTLERLNIPEDVKYTAAERAFKLCCARGRLNHFAWSKMKNSITDEQFVKLLEGKYRELKGKSKDAGVKRTISFSGLPNAWKWKDSGVPTRMGARSSGSNARFIKS